MFVFIRQRCPFPPLSRNVIRVLDSEGRSDDELSIEKRGDPADVQTTRAHLQPLPATQPFPLPRVARINLKPRILARSHESNITAARSVAAPQSKRIRASLAPSCDLLSQSNVLCFLSSLFLFCNILVLPIELCILFEVLRLGSCTWRFKRLCDRSDCERDFRMLVAILEFSHFDLAYFSETKWSFNIWKERLTWNWNEKFQ